MKKDVKEDNKNNNANKIKEEENYDDLDDIGNLNINQEVDIKENPLKHIVNTKKNLIKKSVDDNFNDSDIQNKNKKKKRDSVLKGITYDDIYLGNDMFVSAPKSYPRDFEKHHKFQLTFSNKKYEEKKKPSNLNKTETNTNSKSNTNTNSTNNNSISPNNNNNNTTNSNNIEDDENEEDDFGLLRYNSFEFYGKKGEFSHLRDFLVSINNHRKASNDCKICEEDKNYVDEDEIKNKNIFYIENETELNNLNYYSKKNKCNLSFISINLFIKKLCTESLKDKFPILYKSFLYQYQEFLPIPSIIEKIINAFNYYHKQMNIEIPDLVTMLNKIISSQFKNIQDNEELIEKLKEVYKEIENLDWINDAVQKEIENINFILSSNSNLDFDLEYTRYLISDRRKTKAINIRSRTKARVVNNKTMYKYPYFYIFDFSDEEIARNLTLISYKMMSSIDVNELWNNNFSKEDKFSKAPNVMKLIERFDKLMLFIIEDICSYETSKARAKLITKWANIAKRCKELHNYNDLLIINQCFNHYLLKKLISTWKKLSKSTLMLIAELNKFCTNQQCYINIRREMVGCKHIAYIPYLGILIKEIVDIENEYKYIEKFDKYNCMNCVKLQKIYYVVNKFFEFKNYTFTFTQINDLKILDQLNPRTEEEIEEMIIDIKKNQSTFKELIQTGNKKKKTKSDEMFYC